MVLPCACQIILSLKQKLDGNQSSLVTHRIDLCLNQKMVLLGGCLALLPQKQMLSRTVSTVATFWIDHMLTI
jgi:uncharacterized membrane-anchored protein